MPPFLQTLVASGRIVDVILVVLAIEIMALALWRRRSRRPTKILALIVAALPGVCLLLALRAALTGADAAWVAIGLAASFPAHLLDLKLRPPA